jgi:hypothetical protein
MSTNQKTPPQEILLHNVNVLAPAGEKTPTKQEDE